MASVLAQVGDFEGMEVGVLRVGNLRLPTKIETQHRDPIGRVCVRGDDQSTCLVDQAVCGKYIGGSPHRRGAFI